ncbi:hypothetical protein BDL97_05G007200 [Sphagnum fallax]|nr:hypothetical protein BDL97_05G007000 [Sphagnum fallax]KAH8960650.1 hypothetical protein BDL97_05G007200 [Sphagnum fallax]
MVAMAGWMMRGGWGHSSWLVTVITLLAILELHDMVGVVGTRVPHELALQNCFKDQMEISKCIQEAQFHGRPLLHHTPPNRIQSPPSPWTYYESPPNPIQSPPNPWTYYGPRAPPPQ